MRPVGMARFYETQGRMRQAVAMFKRHGWRMSEPQVVDQGYVLEVYHPWPYAREILRLLRGRESRARAKARVAA